MTQPGAKEALLTVGDLRAAVSYDPETGSFASLRSGRRLGFSDPKGYVLLNIGGHKYFAHRLAWLYIHGSWPGVCLDHANGNPSDNRIANLREATHSQNHGNRKPWHSTKLKGAFHKGKGRWFAQFRDKHLGTFDSEQAAHQAYAAAARAHFGEFARVE